MAPLLIMQLCPVDSISVDLVSAVTDDLCFRWKREPNLQDEKKHHRSTCFGSHGALRSNKGFRALLKGPAVVTTVRISGDHPQI